MSWGHLVQFCYLTSVRDGVVLHFRLIGPKMILVLVCFLHVCVSEDFWAMPVYLPPFSQPGAWQLYRAFIPSRSLGMQGISPRHTWSECPSSSYSHTQIQLLLGLPTPPPAPTSLNSDTIDRHSPKSRHLALHTYTCTHPGEPRGKSGISRNTLEKQEKTEETRCKMVVNKRERWRE